MTPEQDETDIGGTVSRKEDHRVLVGDSKGTDDVTVPGALHVKFIRSEAAHARYHIDATAAREHGGVVAVYTADDVERSDTPTPARFSLYGPPMQGLEYPDEAYLQDPLPAEKARYHGEIIGVVVAEDRPTARDAVEDVTVEYDTCEPVLTAREAVAEDAPLVHESAPDNVVFEGSAGDADRTRKAFERAAYTAELEKEPQRVAPSPLEPRSAIATYEPSTDRLDFTATTQIPHGYRRLMAQMLDHPESKIDVSSPDMGGGFGSRQHPYPADVLVGWCALDLGESVRWRASRTANQRVGTDGRGYEGTWEIALGEAGEILGVRADVLYDLGAWVARGGAGISEAGNGAITGQYDVPAAYAEITGVVTNKARVDAYRGVTVTPMLMMLERLVDRVAKKADMDPAELRRRNFVDPEQFPYENATGEIYDSGDYEPNFDLCLETVGYEEVRRRQQQLRNEGRHLGIGISCYVEGSALGPSEELDIATWGYGGVQIHPTGDVTVYSGGSNHGQGHETSLAQVASDELGVPFENVHVVEDSTKEVPDGVGTFASRTAALCGSAITESCQKLVEKGKRVTAHRLGADSDEVTFVDGVFGLRGDSDDTLTLEAMASAAHVGEDIPDEMAPGLEAETHFDPETRTWSFGVHAAVVEVDPATGEITFHDYVATEDCGVQINPTIVEGQTIGGIAQGLGQALYEEVEYGEDGTLESALFRNEALDTSGGYALPKAETMPEITVESTTTPSPVTPHGAKGSGESGAMAAPGAVMNAIEDALEPFDPDPLTPPVTPETLWRVTGGGGDG